MAETDPNVEGFPECVHLREHTSENRAGIAFHRSWTPAYGNRPEDLARRYIPEPRLTAALAREGALREALTQLLHNAEAYPIDRFRPMTEEDYAKAHEALKKAGYSSDRLHAAWGRHLMRGVATTARAALLDGGRHDA